MMESGHPRHPSFGLEWEFVPGRDPAEDFAMAREFERSGFSHWSLRLETHLKYGGPLNAFLEERGRRAQVRFFSDYLPVAPASDWETVHRLATVALLDRSGPARLTCRRLLPQIPAPLSVLDELLARLPVSTEVNLLAATPAAFDLVRRSGEVSATVAPSASAGGVARGNAWVERIADDDADLITEIRVDPLEDGFSIDAAAAGIRRVLESSRGTESLDVTFGLPVDSERMREAGRRAELVRDRVLSGAVGSVAGR